MITWTPSVGETTGLDNDHTNRRTMVTVVVRSNLNNYEIAQHDALIVVVVAYIKHAANNT